MEILKEKYNQILEDGQGYYSENDFLALIILHNAIRYVETNN